MKELFVRKLTKEQKQKFANATHKTINLLREELKLEMWECYFVVKILFEEFPTEYLYMEK